MKKERRVYYFLGIIGLMPWIGLLTGIYLIISGYKLRVRAFTFIGIVNVSITILMLTTLMYFTMNSETFHQAAKEGSEMRLNELIKSIEIYKLNHAGYPDSLNQLTFFDPLFTDMDPMQATIENSDKKFKYYKILDGYYLFSAGVDGIEFTEDDLYPSDEIIINTGYKVSPFAGADLQSVP
jgi:hypothetical protein